MEERKHREILRLQALKDQDAAERAVEVEARERRERKERRRRAVYGVAEEE